VTVGSAPSGQANVTDGGSADAAGDAVDEAAGSVGSEAPGAQADTTRLQMMRMGPVVRAGIGRPREG
jgi:hypothetical protein